MRYTNDDRYYLAGGNCSLPAEEAYRKQVELAELMGDEPPPEPRRFVMERISDGLFDRAFMIRHFKEALVIGPYSGPMPHFRTSANTCEQARTEEDGLPPVITDADIEKVKSGGDSCDDLF